MTIEREPPDPLNIDSPEMRETAAWLLDACIGHLVQAANDLRVGRARPGQLVPVFAALHRLQPDARKVREDCGRFVTPGEQGDQ